MTEQKQSLFKRVLKKYDQFCKELGVDQGTCRGCVPVVKFDPEPEQVKEKSDNNELKSN